jgi:hypothetical protein
MIPAPAEAVRSTNNAMARTADLYSIKKTEGVFFSKTPLFYGFQGVNNHFSKSLHNFKKNYTFVALFIKPKSKNMKKLFAVVALVGLMASCNSKKKDEKTEETKMDTAVTTTPPTTMEPTTTPTTTTNSDVPKFAVAEVQKYVDDYTAFVKSYVEAYRTKDMTKISSLSTKTTEWATKSQSVAMKLANNQEEATKFTNYMTKLSQEMTDAVTGNK